MKMRRNFFRCGMLCMLALSMMLTSCLQEEDIVEMVEEKYNKSWVETFGAIDPEHDFNTAMGVTANFNLSGFPEDSYTVKIYTANPINKDSRVLARKNISNKESLKFDVEKIKTNVFVTVKGKNKNKLVVNGYYDIVDGEIHINEFKKEARNTSEDECNVTIGDNYEKDFIEQYWDSQQNVNVTKNILLKENCFYLNNPAINELDSYWTIEDFDHILGIDAPFEELKDNENYWGNNFEKNVIYEMASGGGDFTLTLNFHNSSCVNHKLGYMYWDKNDPEGYKTVTRYIINKQETLCELIKFDEYTDHNNDGIDDSDQKSQCAGQTLNYNISSNNHIKKSKVYGCEIRLVYFGSNGQSTPSFNFPEGTCIALFIITSNESCIFYSIPDLNMHNIWPECSRAHAVTFNYNDDTHNTTFLGFEDGNDHDLNDIMFFASGNFIQNGNIVINNQTASDNSWIIACEDLGTTGDYDFNDVVFKVTHVAGEENATLTPLAAGGTLPIEVYFDDNKIGDAEFHTLFSGVFDHKQPINAHAFDKSCPQTYQINVGTDFTITNLESLNRFKVKVEGNNGISNFIEMGNREGSTTAPQMIVLPDTWKWPKESVLIHNAYVKFGDWNKTQTKNMDWYKYNDSKQVVNWTPSATE